MGRDNWILRGLQKPSPQYADYLKSRGVDESCRFSFHSWKPHPQIECPKFKAMYGSQGEKVSEHLITPITSPRGEVIGLELRKVDSEGNKRVNQYRTESAQWNPYALGAEDAFKSLWEGNDLWIVEGIFDKVALDRVVPRCDAVISTLRAGMDSNTMEMISRYYTPASTIYVCYDNDETGQKKGSWLQRELTQRGMRAILWRYRGKDPNEVWARGGDRGLQRMFL